VVANTLICLMHQTNYLLDLQITALERDFVQEGGYTEPLATARMAERRMQNQSHRTEPSDQIPKCPLCGRFLALRTARKGSRVWSQFWGCTGYPECKGTRPLDTSHGSDRSTTSDGSV